MIANEPKDASETKTYILDATEEGKHCADEDEPCKCYGVVQYSTFSQKDDPVAGKSIFRTKNYLDVALV